MLQRLQRKVLPVRPNTTGFLFFKHQLKETLKPGIYKVFDPFNYYNLMLFSTVEKVLTVVNQEVLSKDNIAFRFSFYIRYSLRDPKKFLEHVNFEQHSSNSIANLEQDISNLVQIKIRDQLALLTSEEINNNRNTIPTFQDEEMSTWFADKGVVIHDVKLRDLTFPRAIQELFSQRLESKIRTEVMLEEAQAQAQVALEEAKAKSQVVLEEARGQVAAARALKNASEIMKDDEVAQFNKVMETLVKISTKGNHTFYLGDALNKFLASNGKH